MQIKTESNLRYGILLSGGLDSAILLYLLIKSNPEIDIQPFTIPKTDGAALYANPVIEHFNSKFGTVIPKTILVGNPTVHHRYQSTTAVRTIFYRYPVDQLFIGINKNPTELENYPGAPMRDTKSDHPKITFPFVDMTKDQIIKIMFDEDQEDLMSLTHSCTERSDTRCGTCWQCTERKWAFSKLGKNDVGVV